MNDQASLANLNDIVLIPPPPWWPPAPGWYALAFALLIILIWSIYHLWHRYHSNRYRRAAMAELTQIETEQSAHAASLLPALLKRTALHAYPREQVAALSGEQWRGFLDQHCASEPFKGEAGDLLTKLAYHPDAIKRSDLQPLLNSAKFWIKHHRAELC
jgi:hypothetical protein